MIVILSNVFGMMLLCQAQATTVAIDEAHNNWHTKDGRYKVFSDVLVGTGFNVVSNKLEFSENNLEDVDVLVIANAIHANDVEDWTLPNYSALNRGEIEALNRWIKKGGSLMLIADHFPFPNAIEALASSFGFYFTDGYVRNKQNPKQIYSLKKGNLKNHALLRGKNKSNNISEIRLFTGSAFLSPPKAHNIISLGKGAVSKMPKDPHEADKESILLDVEGFHQGSVLEFGKGRIAVFSEAAMFTRQTFPSRTIEGKRYPEVVIGLGTEHAEQNEQLLVNTVQWLAKQY